MKTLYKYSAIVLIAISSYSCKEQLSAPPLNAKVEGNTILDQATAQIALNGAYYNFANATMEKNGWQSHQLYGAQYAGWLGYGFGVIISVEENRPDLGGPSFWNEAYKAINTSNGIIDGVKQLPDTKFTGNRKAEMIAEAMFIRSYENLRLLCNYAEWFDQSSTKGVLFRTELSTLGNAHKKRSTVKESYDIILSDLNEVIANAPVTNPNYYATKWAGMALKMRLLMMRGEAGDYVEVVKLADEIINSGNYQLELSMLNLFRTAGLTSKEVIMGIQPQATQAEDFYSKTRQYWPGASGIYIAKAAFKTLLNNDPRQAWMTGTAGPRATTTTPGAVYFTKYAVQGSPASNVTETDYVLRLTEIYLLKAEAILRSGGSLASAKTIIHLIQEKAGITSTTNNFHYLAVENASTADALLIELYKETSKNLVAEDSQEWMALVRFPLETVKILRPTITKRSQYILPVPLSEFVYNPLFGEQNSGYASN